MVIITHVGEYSDTFAKYLRPTNIVDFDYGSLRKKANLLTREASTDYQVISACWEFVSSMPEGLDKEDSKASEVLAAHRGMCNTKTSLFVALCRCGGVPARVHAWRVHKSVHKGHFPSFVVAAMPATTLFTYPEVYYKDEWKLLSEALYSPSKPDWDACPFDDASSRAHPLKEEWISEDLGSFWHPDSVYEKFGTNDGGWRRLALPFVKWWMNA